MTIGAFLLVVGVHLLAAISPGPAFVVSVRAAAVQGFGTAAALALGFGIGAAAWAVAAMAGLALLFEVVPAAFVALKVLGGAFLVWIAVRMWRHSRQPLDTARAAAPPSPAAAVRFGLFTFLTNPKSAVFFGAVFVGLMPPEAAPAWKAAVVGAVFANETLWYLVVAWAFSRAAPSAVYLRLKTLLDRTFGTLIAVLGIEIALT